MGASCVHDIIIPERIFMICDHCSLRGKCRLTDGTLKTCPIFENYPPKESADYEQLLLPVSKAEEVEE